MNYCHNCHHWMTLVDGVYCGPCHGFWSNFARMPVPADDMSVPTTLDDAWRRSKLAEVRLMRKGRTVGSNYPSPVIETPDSSILSGLTTEVSRETRGARNRAEYGARVNTNANRKNGGGATWGRVSAEYLAGRKSPHQRPNQPSRRADDHGMILPAQHKLCSRSRTKTRRFEQRHGRTPNGVACSNTGFKSPRDSQIGHRDSGQA